MAGILAHGPLRYRAMVGTGGIGSGRFFLLQGNQSLGREESRSGRFLDQRDYCKLFELATRYGLFRAASFTAGELRTPHARNLLAYLDLPALNVEEAAAAAEISPVGSSAEAVAEKALRRLSSSHPALWLCVTAAAQVIGRE